jgi:large subunit ribosomal protein L9
VGEGGQRVKVIFLREVAGSGKTGEVKEVSEGYARNFLLPRGFALRATPGVLEELSLKIQARKDEKTVDDAKLVELAQQIDGTEVHFQVRIGSGDRLFGSITAADIAEELNRVLSFPINKRKVDLNKPLRQAGSYDIGIKLTKDLVPVVKVILEPERN